MFLWFQTQEISATDKQSTYTHTKIAFYQVYYLGFDIVLDPNRKYYKEILHFAYIQSTVFSRFIIGVSLSAESIAVAVASGSMYQIFFVRKHYIFYTGYHLNKM